jgi:hypothetical protein
MNKTEKLIRVFDFIAEYLSETQPEVVTIEPVVKAEEMELTNKGDDSLKRAYTLMKKLDERDKQHAIVTTEVKKATDSIKEEMDRLKKEHEVNIKIATEEEIKETLKEEVKEELKEEIKNKVVVSFSSEEGVKSMLEIQPKELKSVLEGSIIGVSSRKRGKK